jgi:hypothetical protein
MPKSRAHSMNATDLATRALGFLASDPERLGRFLALSGIDPATVRAAARNPNFLPSVLDHIMSDERLLLAFAEAENLRPEAIGQAHATLSNSGADE